MLVTLLSPNRGDDPLTNPHTAEHPNVTGMKRVSLGTAPGEFRGEERFKFKVPVMVTICLKYDEKCIEYPKEAK